MDEVKEADRLAQWQSTGLACGRPLVQTPAGITLRVQMVTLFSRIRTRNRIGSVSPLFTINPVECKRTHALFEKSRALVVSG